VVEAIQTWASTVRSITPSLPDVNVPFAENLPKPQDLVAGAYDFAEQLLASQGKFAEDVVKATAPLTAGKEEVPAKKTPPRRSNPEARGEREWFAARSLCLRY
jgi:hypothetical protein